MHSLKYASTLLLLVAAIAFGGCGNDTVGQAGFLSDYSRLQPDAQLDGAMVYQNSSPTLADYDRVIVDPVAISFAPSSDANTIDPQKVAEVTTYGRSYLVERMGEKYTVVEAPGPGVMRLRVAITDIKQGNTLLNVIPQTKLTGAGLGGASLEAEMVDARSGEQIAAIMDSRKGSQFALEGADPMDNAKQVIRIWVDDFMKRVERAKSE